jgi:hypothetical protein
MTRRTVAADKSMQCLCQARNGSIESVDHGTAVLIDLWAGKMVRHLGDSRVRPLDH